MYWLHEHGIDPSDHLVEEIFRAAKERNRVLSDDEVLEICKFEATEREQPLPLDTPGRWKKEVAGVASPRSAFGGTRHSIASGRSRKGASRPGGAGTGGR